MTAAAPRAGAAPSLPLRLRQETRDAHQSLEDALGLLEPPLRRERFLRTLRRFHGFHAAWEPAIGARPEVAAIFAGRDRLAHLERDLRALGVSPAELASAPRCRAAARLVVDEAAALGSLYVMEGSTLGGQVIARALRDADWLPEGGLTYFGGHGRDAGAMWRALQARLTDVPLRDQDAVVDGARGTFALLQAWAPL